MKKLISFAIVIAGFLFLTSMALKPLNVLYDRKVDEPGKPIPEDVMKIMNKSCVNCHSQPGNFMALSHLDLDNWGKYSAEKQASKAKDMCNMVGKDRMPPKKFRAEHADGIPSTAEIKTICDWARSLQTESK